MNALDYFWLSVRMELATCIGVYCTDVSLYVWWMTTASLLYYHYQHQWNCWYICCKLSGIPSGSLFSYNNTTANFQHCVIVLLIVTLLLSSGELFYGRKIPGMAIFNRSELTVCGIKLRQSSHKFLKSFTGESSVYSKVRDLQKTLNFS